MWHIKDQILHIALSLRSFNESSATVGTLLLVFSNSNNVM